MQLCVCPNPSIDTYWHLNAIVPQKPNRIFLEKQFPGGKGIHVAFGLKELNEEVIILGSWAGQNGQWIREKCELAGIASFGIEVIGENRRCISIISNDARWRDTEFLNSGPEISMAGYNSLLEIYSSKLAHTKCVTLSGSWPQTDKVNPYVDFIDRANELKIPCWLDYAGLDLRILLQHKPFGLHLNHHEVNLLFPDQHLENAIETILENVEFFALTHGEKGLYLFARNAEVHASVTLEQIFSSIGSGDCLTAGLAYATTHQFDMIEMARVGVACGAANCIRKDLGMFYIEDVKNLLPKIKISPSGI